MRIKLTAALIGLLAVSPSFAQQTKSSLTSTINSQFPDNSTGGITPSILRSVTTAMVNSYQQYTSVNAQVGTSYTVQTTDYGALVTLNNAAPVAVTLPQANGSFSNFNVYIKNVGSGLVTITPTTSTINGGATQTVASGQSIWVISDGTSYQTWTGFGSGVVNSGTAGQLAYFPSSSAAVSGNANFNVLGSTLTLGVAGSAVGVLSFANGTSGTVSLTPVNGALGSSVLTLPIATDTLALLATSQALTNKTYNGLNVPTTTGTLSIGNGKTLTASNSLTLAGVDSKTLTVNNSLTLAGTDATTATFPSTNSTVASLNIADQTLTGGANVTSNSLGTVSSGTLTLDCGSRPLQYFTNNGAFTLAAPASDGSCIVEMTNGASAGTITYSGWNVGSNTGDNITSINTYKFDLFVRRINGHASYQWSALQ